MREAQPYLAAQFQHHLGSFALNAAFELSSPWSVLFGPSGSGKSTLLRLLAGLERANKSTLKCFGRVCINSDRKVFLSPSERNLGLVMQKPTLFLRMDVADNIGFGLQKMDAAARSNRVAEMLELFEVAALAHRRPAQLSGGEQQRVALARALAREPRMIMLDEPFSALDGDLKDRIFNRLSRWLSDRNIPALYVSHDPTEAFQTNADVLVMQEGRITAQGPAADVLSAERNRLLRHLNI